MQSGADRVDCQGRGTKPCKPEVERGREQHTYVPGERGSFNANHLRRARSGSQEPRAGTNATRHKSREHQPRPKRFRG